MVPNPKNCPEIVLIKGPTGAGKTQMLQKKYQELLDSGFNSNQIIVLVRNRRESIFWRNSIKVNFSSTLRIQTFFGFIQGEIKKYWPILSSKIEGSYLNTIEPIFLTTETSQFILTGLVEDFRNQGKLLDITARSQKIALEGLSILSKSASAKIDLTSISDRLYKFCNNKTPNRERLFKEFQELLNQYINFCTENGFIDYSLAIEIYNKLLFSDENYKSRLQQEVHHLIVDGLEDAVPCEINFINWALDHVKTAIISFSTDNTFSRRLGACPEYAENIIFPRCKQVINLTRSYTTNENLFVYSELLYDKLLKKGKTNCSIHNINPPIENSIQEELRSEMIEKITKRIHQLLNEGLCPKDIAVICPIVDGVLEYYLKNYFEKLSINIINISRTTRYIDQSFIRALVTLACLCHPHWEINPSEFDIANLVSIVLGLDPVRSGLIARETVKLKPFTLPDFNNLELRERIGFKNSDKYDFLKNWIEKYREGKPLPIDIFLQSGFVAILLNLPNVESQISIYRAFIESATNFLKIIENKLNEDPGKTFIKMIKQGIKPAETIQDLEQKIFSEDLIISTPQAYLYSSLNKKVQIWTDVSSSLWHRSDVEELDNPYALSPLYKEGDTWTEDLDEEYKLLKCGVLIKRLLRRCSRLVILAQSQYSQDGYENDGLLPEILEGITYETTS